MAWLSIFTPQRPNLKTTITHHNEASFTLQQFSACLYGVSRFIIILQIKSKIVTCLFFFFFPARALSTSRRRGPAELLRSQYLDPQAINYVILRFNSIEGVDVLLLCHPRDCGILDFLTESVNRQCARRTRIISSLHSSIWVTRLGRASGFI